MSVVISSELVLESDPAIPLSNPRILYDDIWKDGVITVSSEAVGFEGVNVADGLTWDYWRPTSLPATIDLDCSDGCTVDYALLAAHDLGTTQATVQVQRWDGAAWQDLSIEVSPGTDHVLAFLFAPVVGSKFRLLLNGENSPQQMPSIGIVMMGESLHMQRGVKLNHRPITMSRRTVVRPHISEGGQLLGRSIARKGVETKIEFQYLDSAWFRTHFDPFIEAARVRPFGWVWQPTAYPAEVALVWTPSGKEDIVPELAGMMNRMNVAFDVEGIVE